MQLNLRHALTAADVVSNPAAKAASAADNLGRGIKMSEYIRPSWQPIIHEYDKTRLGLGRFGGWFSYAVYPQEARYPKGFGIFVGDAVRDWADQWRDRWEWGWYAPEEITPEPPPRPTLGEIWGNERWGK